MIWQNFQRALLELGSSSARWHRPSGLSYMPVRYSFSTKTLRIFTYNKDFPGLLLAEIKVGLYRTSFLKFEMLFKKADYNGKLLL